MCFKQYQYSKNFGQLSSDSGPLCTGLKMTLCGRNM